MGRQNTVFLGTWKEKEIHLSVNRPDKHSGYYCSHFTQGVAEAPEVYVVSSRRFRKCQRGRLNPCPWFVKLCSPHFIGFLACLDFSATFYQIFGCCCEMWLARTRMIRNPTLLANLCITSSKGISISLQSEVFRDFHFLRQNQVCHKPCSIVI